MFLSHSITKKIKKKGKFEYTLCTREKKKVGGKRERRSNASPFSWEKEKRKCRPVIKKNTTDMYMISSPSSYRYETRNGSHYHSHRKPADVVKDGRKPHLLQIPQRRYTETHPINHPHQDIHHYSIFSLPKNLPPPPTSTYIRAKTSTQPISLQNNISPSKESISTTINRFACVFFSSFPDASFSFLASLRWVLPV